ncbi:hypothetical protein QJQ45_023446 [Haematococcus lacustris]|nr:hypothetical protein QJQ45_023446 [Haematococcus lacustris]
MQRNRQRRRNRNASDSLVDREADAQPEPSQAQRNMQANGEAHWARKHSNTWHAKKCKMHTVMRGVSAAGLEEGAVVASEVVEARLYGQLVLWVEACSKRALLASLLLSLMVRGWFTRVTVLADGQEVFDDIPAEDAVIPSLAERNLYLQLGRGMPRPGMQSRPSAAVAAVLAAYPGLRASAPNSTLYLAFSTTPTPWTIPAWIERQRSWVARSVQGKEVTWLQGAGQGEGGVVPTYAMRDEVARQRGLLGLGQGVVVVVDKDWLKSKANRSSLLRHAVDTSRQLEEAHITNPMLGTPDLWPNRDQTFAHVVHTDGVAVSVLFTRPKPARPPDELPRMGKQEGAVKPLADLDADWLGCDPGKTDMATVAYEERYPSGAVQSVWHRSLPAGQYYRQSGITEHAKVSKAWMTVIKPRQDELSQVTNYTASLQRYRQYAATTLATWPAMWAELSKPRLSNARFRLYRRKQSTVAYFWADVSRPYPASTVRDARVRCNSAATGCPLALAYWAAGFSGSGSIGSRGVPVKQTFPGVLKCVMSPYLWLMLMLTRPLQQAA